MIGDKICLSLNSITVMVNSPIVDFFLDYLKPKLTGTPQHKKEHESPILVKNH